MVDDEDKDFDLTSENEDQINEIDKMIEMECNKFNDVSSPFFSACIYCDSVDLSIFSSMTFQKFCCYFMYFSFNILIFLDKLIT